MKEWWSNKSIHEKQTMLGGAILVFIFLFITLVWSPLSNTVSTLRHQVQQDQKLLLWMQAADEKIQNSNKKTPVDRQEGPLLSKIQSLVKQSPIAKDLTQLHQAEDSVVALSFKQVGFDELMAWLMALSEQHNLRVKQFSIAPSGLSGVVSAEFTLTA